MKVSLKNNSLPVVLTEDSKYDIFVGDLSGDKVSNTGSGSDWAIYSGFARATYNYDEKYLLEFNIRNDYSSYFAKGNRSGVFPSFSAGWRISEEKFWSVLKPYVPSLKIRGSWGLVGNNRIGAYQYMQTVSVTNGISFGDKLAQTATFVLQILISNGKLPVWLISASNWDC